MTLQQLQNLWQKRFAGVPPVGHLRRSSFPNQWVRFHSLPDMKRHPESEDEWQTVLHRHNAVIDHLAGFGDSVNAISTVSSDGPSLPAPTTLYGNITPEYWQTVSIGELDDNFDTSTKWRLFISSFTWQTHCVDAFLRRVAMWEDVNLLVCHKAFEWVYAPYDGGADIITSNTESRDALKLRFQQWLSPLPGGH